jgi:hypothetical protein
MSRPDPPIQLRQFLTVARRQGFPFEQAWEWALERVRWPHATKHRHAYKDAIAETRWAYEAAYHGRDVPGGKGLVALEELLSFERDELRGQVVRAPAVVVSGKPAAKSGIRFNEHRREAA